MLDYGPHLDESQVGEHLSPTLGAHLAAGQLQLEIVAGFEGCAITGIADQD